MRIPSTFWMLGHKWTVEVIPRGDWEDDLKVENVGATDFANCRIRLLGGPKTYMEQTYIHELIHAALKYMGEDRLDTRENFVDLLAGFIHQALVTGEDGGSTEES